MSRTVVITQPMLFPWVGLLEQVCLSDVCVIYDDVQFSKGSFVNRVQLKTATGPKWMTSPLKNLRLGQLIREVALDDTKPWRRDHLAQLRSAYSAAPHAAEMLELVQGVYVRSHTTIGALAADSMKSLCEYFGIVPGGGFVRSSELGIDGSSWPRVLKVIQHLGGDRYVTGHGARSYMDHEAMERGGVRVMYMDYAKTPYRQLHGKFSPFISALDLVANEGVAGRAMLNPRVLPWREFCAQT
ncbi:MAG: WbqC family protein [Phycisphaerales bacterium]